MSYFGAGMFGRGYFGAGYWGETGGTSGTAQPSSGFEIGRLGGRRREPDELRRQREEFGIPNKAAAIIAAVALRQAEALRQDEQQRFDELVGELELQGVAWDARYLAALNTLRERAIDEEIGRRLRIIQDNEDILTLLMLAASTV